MMSGISGLLDFFTQFARIISTVVDVLWETIIGVGTILGDIPEFIELLLTYFDMMPGPAKTFGYMMLYILVQYVTLKIINLVLPFF